MKEQILKNLEKHYPHWITAREVAETAGFISIKFFDALLGLAQEGKVETRCSDWGLDNERQLMFRIKKEG